MLMQLMNLPTIVETHKTFDNKIFLKSGDIGQVQHTPSFVFIPDHTILM